MFVCLCVMFMQATFPLMDQLHIYTIIGLDPEGGQWLFKLQSYSNNKNYRRNRAKYPRHRYTPQNSICGTVVKYRSTYPIKYDVTSCVLRVHSVVCCLIACHRQCSVRFSTGYCRWL